jgi:phosphopentomutase
MRRIDRAFVLVADGLGVGAMPDAASFGDAGADTLGHAAASQGGLLLPALGALGIGRLTDVRGVPPAASPRGAFARMAEASAAKDTTTGHWEMTGLPTKEPFATFPGGFPPALVDAFEKATGRKLLGNKAASGTVILEELGAEHVEKGALILYTSADSVFQIAAHESVVSVEELYEICEAARRLCDPYRIGRVIARPFVGEPGRFVRTYHRKDFAMAPPGETLLDRLSAAGIHVTGVGKIPDIFSMRGIHESIHTEGNADGLARTLRLAESAGPGLVFVNLVDFDMLWGHRRDAAGFARALVELDRFVPELTRRLGPGDVVAITADHGCDPTFRGTDHTREHVPLLLFGPAVRPADLGTRSTFADLGATLAEAFDVGPLGAGQSFLGDVLG